MTPLTFTLKTEPKFTLDVSPLTPENIASVNRADIKKLALRYGKEQIGISQLFSITGNNPKHIQILNSSEKLIFVGHGMCSGSIEVTGNAGDFVGQEMRGGIITIDGNAGSWIGNNMSGGRIEINGNVGDHLGAGLPGDACGMSDGLIFVSGNAGDRVGDRMRRGIIIIQGKAGDYCGSRMGAGTIIVLDKAGKYAGFGMKRGTIVLAKKPRHLAPTFKSCGILKMQFLRLLFSQLSAMDKQYNNIFRNYGPEAHRYSGDLASNGKGEILIL